MRSLYLIAYYYQKPSHKRVQTNKPGWMKDAGNSSWDEQVALSKQVKNRDLSMSKVIIDLVTKKVLKNSWNTSASFDEMFMYYSDNYPKYTKEVMLNLDPDYYYKIFPKEKPQTQQLDFSAKTSDSVVVIDTSTSN